MYKAATNTKRLGYSVLPDFCAHRSQFAESVPLAPCLLRNAFCCKFDLRTQALTFALPPIQNCGRATIVQLFTKLYIQTDRARASDVDVKGVPTVVFADTPVFSRRAVSERALAGLLPRGRCSGVRVKLVVLVEVPVLHHAEAGGGAEVLTAALVLLDRLVKGPELAQEGHVLLT